jgi:hypothetical protein
MARKEIESVCASIGLKFTIVKACGEQRSATNWEQPHYLYRVKLARGRKSYTCDFRTGMGWTTEPTIADLVSSLMLDASCGEISFEDFCSDFGYDSDSRSAERTHRACKRTHEALSRLMSDAERTDLNDACSDF